MTGKVGKGRRFEKMLNPVMDGNIPITILPK
jgi:hypothetical protein